MKIADFGLARIFKSPVTPLFDNGVVVTVWYRSIELLLGTKHYTPAIDMWAIGAIFSEMITSKPLFPGNEQSNSSIQKDQLDKICTICGKPDPISWPTLLQMQNYFTYDFSNYPSQSQLNKIYEKVYFFIFIFFIFFFFFIFISFFYFFFSVSCHDSKRF